MTDSDLQRLRAEYSDREHRLAAKNPYSFFNPDYLFTIQQRQRAILRALRRCGISSLGGLRALEIGCGAGGVLTELVALGADPEQLAGIDLLPDRLHQAHQRLPSTFFAEADGQNLPFQPHQFDLVLQFTAFSSILDDRIRRCVAQEMLRVLNPGGTILWYDFWWNPTNSQTRGIAPAEIRGLLPGCKYHFQRITLAPPIARRIVPISWSIAALLENLRVFNSHFLVAIENRD